MGTSIICGVEDVAANLDTAVMVVDAKIVAMTDSAGGGVGASVTEVHSVVAVKFTGFTISNGVAEDVVLELDVVKVPL